MAEGKKSFIEYLTYPDGDNIPLRNALRALLGESVWDAYQGPWMFGSIVLEKQTWSFENGVWLALQGGSGVEPVEGAQWTLIFDGDAIPAGPRGPQGDPGPSVSAGIRRDVDVQSPDTVWVVPRLPVESAAWAIASLTPTAAPSFIRTAGYGGPGDRGAALYKKVDVEPTHPGKFAITLASGAVTAWYELSEAAPSIAMFGAWAGATAAANSTAINNALAYCKAKGIRTLLVPEGVHTSNDNLSNDSGAIFTGSGRIIVTGSGKPLSLGHLDLGRDIVGAHNLLSYFATIVSNNGLANIVLEGDSNTEGGGWLTTLKSYPDKVLRKIGRQRGYSPQIYNYGIGGKGIEHFTPAVGTRVNSAGTTIPAWLANTQFILLIMSFGTNNASQGEEFYRTTLRTKLTEVRAVRYGNLGILLLSPPIGTDSFSPTGVPHGRDEAWALTVHRVNLEMIEEFNVAVADRATIYRHMRGSYGGAHMDTLSDYDAVTYRTDSHIHSRDMLNSHYWANIVGAAIFPESLAIWWKSNTNIYHLTFDNDVSPYVASNPGDYDYGRNLWPVVTAQGFPFDSVLLNDHHFNGSYQMLMAQGYGAIRCGVSTYVNDWHYIGKDLKDPTLGTNVTVAGASTKSVKTGSHGMMRSYYNITGNIVVDQLLMTLPVGHRPDAAVVVALSTGAGGGTAVIWPNGQITAKSAHTAPGFFNIGPWVI